MTSIRQQIEADIDDVAKEVKRFKLAAAKVLEVREELNAPLDEAALALRIIQSKSFIVANAPLMEKISRLEEIVARLRELKNMIDGGTFVVQTDRVMDDVWKSLP